MVMDVEYPIAEELPPLIGIKEPCKSDIEIIWSTDPRFWEYTYSEVEPDDRND